ncbi:DUF503 domain-containing protein [Alkalicella caledoniensis]|uniref:DUF503 domain-containing protein n=1 Tax=Alkalicella caledoniensis TaxID=2731377 RepID=A0A7G9W752_ALKCA|nr:DUF503 domain-containing protein [Alkalicella caledoniensis]QNO14514.1 DUF503 domain-containing protein [Alkalicella caledoniensis]
MDILLLELTIHIFECDNLKTKRNVANSMSAKIKHKFNVSVAQEHDQLLNRFQLGISMISTDAKILYKTKDAIISYIDELNYSIEIVDIYSEIL